MGEGGQGEETRLRLLAAAGQLFAQKGYRAATIRDICRRAKANVASVHYHFGSKEKLYEAVLRHAHDEALRRYPPDMGLDAAGSPEQKLATYVRSMLLRMLAKDENAWHGALMAREMVEPTPMLARFVDRFIMPRAEILRRIVAEILGPGADPFLVGLCTQSITGQCRSYVFSRPIVARLFPELTFDEQGVERLAEHIARFSLAAIKNYHGQMDVLPSFGPDVPEASSGSGRR
ncbi:MAG: CerR family C-terminal domain-containing protein [Desulfovibrio sp.]|nr:CerR family C-terminal domain-containing protein [Desulfovibrio sp.]